MSFSCKRCKVLFEAWVKYAAGHNVVKEDKYCQKCWCLDHPIQSLTIKGPDK